MSQTSNVVPYLALAYRVLAQLLNLEMFLQFVPLLRGRVALALILCHDMFIFIFTYNSSFTGERSVIYMPPDQRREPRVFPLRGWIWSKPTGAPWNRVRQGGGQANQYKQIC